jgi:hypothetical protein
MTIWYVSPRSTPAFWIDHFRSGNKELHQALNRGQIVTYPCIIAELALRISAPQNARNA